MTPTLAMPLSSGFGYAIDGRGRKVIL